MVRRSPLTITQSRRVRKSTKFLPVCVVVKFIERSYLNLTGEGSFQKVLKECHGILDRYQLMFEACELNMLSEKVCIDLGRLLLLSKDADSVMLERLAQDWKCSKYRPGCTLMKMLMLVWRFWYLSIENLLRNAPVEQLIRGVRKIMLGVVKKPLVMRETSACLVSLHYKRNFIQVSPKSRESIMDTDGQFHHWNWW